MNLNKITTKYGMFLDDNTFYIEVLNESSESFRIINKTNGYTVFSVYNAYNANTFTMITKERHFPDNYSKPAKHNDKYIKQTDEGKRMSELLDIFKDL